MPDTLAFTMRQSLVATDSAGRAKSLSTAAGNGPAGASADAGSSETTIVVAGSAATAGSELTPHSDSATGTHKVCRRMERNIIERLVDLAMPGVETRASEGSAYGTAPHVHRADGLTTRVTNVTQAAVASIAATATDTSTATGRSGVVMPVTRRFVNQSDGERRRRHPTGAHGRQRASDNAAATRVAMRSRQMARAFGGRSRTATMALAADVRRNGMAADGCASGRRSTTLCGRAVQTTHAAQAEQLAC
ncbi:hypothetical protein PCO31010_01954 [Pandoraea commovens]|uniref:Uncharacterized protein n=1 Tax=Pandoraea commovens TaxID=2508289 RepID=A0A5E4UC90_9BURK|nr:hypothetical protein PCO31010_01954 [Pandoraea commovens]